MATHSRTRFSAMVVLAISCTLIVLVAVGGYSLETLFVLALVEVALLREMVDPGELRGDWQRNVDRLLMVGLIIFSILIFRRILSYVPPEAF